MIILGPILRFPSKVNEYPSKVNEYPLLILTSLNEADICIVIKIITHQKSDRMKKLPVLIICLSTLFFFQSCFKSEQDSEVSVPFDFIKDYVMEAHLSQLRLADGAPISVDLTYRWKVANVDSFRQSFDGVKAFDSLVLKARAREIADLQTVRFLKIDSVFTTQREEFVDAIRTELQFALGGNEAIVKEVIVTNLTFPTRYTNALEDISLKKKEIERINQQSLVDKAAAEAQKAQAIAQGKVSIAQAEAQGRLETIKAGTEDSRRASQLAQAETQKQVQELQALAEARKKQIYADVEIDKERKKMDLALQNQKATREMERTQSQKQFDQELRNTEVMSTQEQMLARQKRMDEFEMEVNFASLCKENPTYANYLVTKELASRVEIAILPTGSEMAVFEDMIKNTMNTTTIQ